MTTEQTVAPQTGEETTFAAWPLRASLQEALARQGFTTPTPVQTEAFPLVRAGRDVLVQSRTGSGKTLAFALPILEGLEPTQRGIAALVISPTRELASQIASVVTALAEPMGLSVATVVGGSAYREQIRAVSRAQIVVGTPGRLVDLQDKGALNLTGVKQVVLDEADEMLDMGFADDLDAILVSMPETRQALLFSATMPPDTRRLADRVLKDPAVVSVGPRGLSSAPTIRHMAYEVFREHVPAALLNVLHAEDPELAIVFCHTKAETEGLCEQLQREGFPAGFLNGDLPQAQRTRTLDAFRERRIRFLVATDVAARGIDVKDVSHVFNLSVPQASETYVHRTGRTGRAGASGTAVTFVQPRDAGRFRRLAHQAGLSLAWPTLPQGEAVRAARRERLVAGLKAASALAETARFTELASELLAGAEPQAVVAALLSRDPGAVAALAAGAEIPVPRKREPRAERPARGGYGDAAPMDHPDGGLEGGRMDGLDGRRPRPARKLSDHQEAGMVRLYLNAGKQHRFTPSRIVQLVCSSASVKGEVIGAIALHPFFSFFDVREQVADKVVSALDGKLDQGRRLKANRA